MMRADERPLKGAQVDDQQTVTKSQKKKRPLKGSAAEEHSDVATTKNSATREHQPSVSVGSADDSSIATHADNAVPERTKKKPKLAESDEDGEDATKKVSEEKSRDPKSRLRGAWDNEQIQQQILEITEKMNQDGSPRRRLRLKQRLSKLKQALDGKVTVGGQLKKKAKNEYHIRKEHVRNADRHQTCLRCRQQGHRLVNCPLNEVKPEGEVSEFGITGQCFLCGKSGHRLKDCPEGGSKRGALPFAQCFLCGETGHIVANCSRNDAGIYPRGGSCFHCGKTDHRKQECPNRNRKPEAQRPVPKLTGTNPDEEWTKVLKHSRKEGALQRKKTKKEKTLKKKIRTAVSS